MAGQVRMQREEAGGTELRLRVVPGPLGPTVLPEQGLL